MEPRTHLAIDRELCGTPVELAAGRAVVHLVATDRMAVDDRGLVHGGFVFGAADHAAMLAVNDPHVVLGASRCRFLAPVRVGDEVAVDARVIDRRGRKVVVEAEARVGERAVFAGQFDAYVLDRHVLDR